MNNDKNFPGLISKRKSYLNIRNSLISQKEINYEQEAMEAQVKNADKKEFINAVQKEIIESKSKRYKFTRQELFGSNRKDSSSLSNSKLNSSDKLYSWSTKLFDSDRKEDTLEYSASVSKTLELSKSKISSSSQFQLNHLIGLNILNPLKLPKIENSSWKLNSPEEAFQRKMKSLDQMQKFKKFEESNVTGRDLVHYFDVNFTLGVNTVDRYRMILLVYSEISRYSKICIEPFIVPVYADVFDKNSLRNDMNIWLAKVKEHFKISKELHHVFLVCEDPINYLCDIPTTCRVLYVSSTMNN